MTIGIPFLSFKSNQTETEYCVKELIKNISMLSNSKKHQFILYSGKHNNDKFNLPSNFEIKKLNSSKILSRLQLNAEMAFSAPDALFVPFYALPFLSRPQNSTVLIHDIAFEFFPQLCSPLQKRCLSLSAKRALTKAGKIVVPTESVKQDILRFYKADSSKIFVVPFGRSEFNKKAGDNKVKIFDFPYLLCIGQLDFRKNTLGLLKAFDLFKGEYRSPHKLVFAGDTVGKGEKIKEAISKHRFRNDIVIYNQSGGRTKKDVIAGADILISPSLYEGFSPSILDAQSLGVPVIASYLSALPEIAGEGAIFVDPHNYEEISGAIMRLFDDENLKNDVVQKGFKNVERFSWEDCAKRILEIIISG